MPVACASNDLAMAARCWECVQPGQHRGIRILLLCAFLNGETMNCELNNLAELAAEAGYTGMPPGQQEAIITYLTCQVANAGGGGGGGSGSVTQGSGAPVAAPSDPTVAAVYYDDDNTSPSYGTVWVWDISLTIWV